MLGARKDTIKHAINFFGKHSHVTKLKTMCANEDIVGCV